MGDLNITLNGTPLAEVLRQQRLHFEQAPVRGGRNNRADCASSQRVCEGRENL